MSKYPYPIYYTPVYIKYFVPNDKQYHIDIAWLAVNDDGEKIWTLSNDNTTIIPNELVVDWFLIK